MNLSVAEFFGGILEKHLLLRLSLSSVFLVADPVVIVILVASPSPVLKVQFSFLLKLTWWRGLST